VSEEITTEIPQRSKRKMIAGRYRVDRLIARGGMAAVYLAEHVDLRRRVAIKVLHPPPDADDSVDFERRFRLEAQTLAALNHHNIVTLHDFGELDDGRCFLAMEYVDGPRLTDILRNGPMDVDAAAALLLQVCRALKYAHKRGVIHRDLKPSNLLIQVADDGEQTMKVVDFGLVKLTDGDQSHTRAGVILGSPHCMSPEQVRGDEVDETADIYSVGVLLFRAVTGKYPFHGSNSTATMVAHINSPIPSLREKNPALTYPAGLENIIHKCLQKEPEQRYPTMESLILDLSTLVDVPVEFGTASVATSAFRQPSRSLSSGGPSKALYAATAGAVLLAVAGLALFWVSSNTPQDPVPAQGAKVTQDVAALTPAETPPPAAAPPAAEAPPAEAEPAPPKEEAAPPPVEEKPKPKPKAERRRRDAAPKPKAVEPPPKPVEEAAPPLPVPEKKAQAEPAPPAQEAPPPEQPDAPDGYKGLPDDW